MIDSYSCLIAATTDHKKIHTGKASHLRNLPEELILQIISFVGPRSSTLVALSQVDKDFHSLMTRVGDAMLVRARSNFRILLPKLHLKESGLSLFIRHARACKNIQRMCDELKQILDKDFVVCCSLGPIVVRSLQSDAAMAGGSDNLIKKPAVSLKEVDTALELALELLGQDALSYFLASHNVTIPDVDKDLIYADRRSIIQHCSERIENQVLSLAGQCGGKVYKFIKMRQVIRNGLVEDKRAERRDLDYLNRARLIMQLVLCRDLELTEQDIELGKDRRRFSVCRHRIVLQNSVGGVFSTVTR